MKIIDSIWYTQFGKTAPVGIVVCYDETEKRVKAYIGYGEGRDQKVDEQTIMLEGAQFPANTAQHLLGVKCYEEVIKGEE